MPDSELTEKAQKKLLKNALAKYSVKCTALTALGICGTLLVLLSLLIMAIAPAWLTILLWIFAAADIIALAVLFAVYEKSALVLEEEPSRYTLAIKCATYKGVLWVGLTWLACFLLLMVCALNAKGIRTVLLVIMAVPALAIIVILLLLRNRGKELYTDAERTMIAKNDKLMAKLVLIGYAVVLVIGIIASVFGFVDIPKDEKVVTYKKDEFVKKFQSIYIGASSARVYGVEVDEDGNYFVDILPLYGSEPVEVTIDGWGNTVELYHLAGSLYFDSYAFDPYMGGFSVYYVKPKDELEYNDFALIQLVHFQKIYLNGYDAFLHKIEEGASIEECWLNGEVVFCDYVNVLPVMNTYYTIFGASAEVLASEYIIKAEGENYSLIYHETLQFSDFAFSMAGIGIAITVIVCFCVYFSLRKKIKVGI